MITTQATIDWRKIKLYIFISFVFSWTVALIMWLTGIGISSITGIVFLAVLYMPGPAIATFIIQKFIYRQGFKQYGWKLEKKAWKWILFTPVLFLSLTILTFLVIGVLGNTHVIPQFGQIDFSREGLHQRLVALASAKLDISNMKIPDIPPKLLFVALLVQGIIGGATINLPFMFGEEFGWRGLMLKETQALGFLKASGFIGLVWGVWHAPIILMGHNYPHYPYLGIVMMCLFTLSVSPLFAYIRIKTRSIFGPCMLHGMINATGTLYALYVAGGNELFNFVAGWAGVIAGCMLTACIFVFDRKFVNDY